MKLFNQLYNVRPWKFAKIALCAVALTAMFALLLGYNIKTEANQQFVYLADSFLHGRLDFQEQHSPFLMQGIEDKFIWTDTASWNGKKFWPLGPFPAIILLPTVAIFGTGFLQGYLSFVFTLLNFYLLWRIGKRFNLSPADALWLASFFIFGSAYLGIAVFSVSWYFAQVVAVTLLLLALHEFFGKKRWWLIGLYTAFAVLTRSNLLLASLFFIFMVFQEKEVPNKKIKIVFQFGFTILASLFLILAYNWTRFGSPLETGYNLQDIPPPLAAARDLGLFSIKHIPGNLFVLLFHGPNPVFADSNSYVLKWPYITADIWGMGIFFTSPIFLYLFSAPWRDAMVRRAALTSLIILLSLITYYGIGTAQIGYRYALDFYPFLYIILCKALASKLPMKAKILILFGIILNWHLVLHFKS